MSAIQMNLAYENPTVALPCVFIDYYMPKCTPVYALIYIYSLRQCVGGATAISSQEIGQLFQILETDVLNAWRYWENAGLIKIDTQGDGMAVTFLAVKIPENKPDNTASKTPSDQTNVLRPFITADRPQYTVEELAIYRQQSRDIERLFAHAEQELGKLLTFHDMNVLFGFYDWLRLPVDVILYLLTYCAEHDRRDLRYIEKAALDWAENGISDVEKALLYVRAFDSEYRDILRAMGQDTGYPTPTQRKYITKWLQEFQLPAALIMTACDMTALQIGKPKFPYVDKILEDWHKKGIKTVEAVSADTDDFARKKAESAKMEVKARPVKTNRFINFKQRERDYAQLEKMEREYLVQSLKG